MYPKTGLQHGQRRHSLAVLLHFLQDMFQGFLPLILGNPAGTRFFMSTPIEFKHELSHIGAARSIQNAVSAGNRDVFPFFIP